MNIFDVKEFFEKINPGKSVSVDLDDSCISQFDMSAVDGVLNLIGHLTFNRARVKVDGQEPVYVPISRHRVPLTFAEFKRKAAAMSDVYFPEDVLENLHVHESLASLSDSERNALPPKDRQGAANCRSNLRQLRADLVSASGLDLSVIHSKLAKYRTARNLENKIASNLPESRGVK